MLWMILVREARLNSMAPDCYPTHYPDCSCGTGETCYTQDTDETWADNTSDWYYFELTNSPKIDCGVFPNTAKLEPRIGWDKRKCLGMGMVSRKDNYLDHRRNSAR